MFTQSDELIVKVSGNTISLAQSPGPPETVLSPIARFPTVVKKMDLISALHYRLGLEQNYLSQIRIRDAKVVVPLSLFIYQSAMDALGSNPKYFIPADFTTRATALVYALLRLLYFGSLLALCLNELCTSALTLTRKHLPEM